MMLWMPSRTQLIALTGLMVLLIALTFIAAYSHQIPLATESISIKFIAKPTCC